MENLLVTFVGLPGTGKSTLCARVAQLLRQRGIPCRVLEESAYRKYRNKVGWLAREVIGHPWRAVCSLRAILATGQPSVLDLVKMVVNWFCLSFLIRRAARAGGVSLFDEGLFQALWSIGLGARNPDWLSSLPYLDPVPPGSRGEVIDTTEFELELLHDALTPAGLRMLGHLVGLSRLEETNTSAKR